MPKLRLWSLWGRPSPRSQPPPGLPLEVVADRPQVQVVTVLFEMNRAGDPPMVGPPPV